MRNENLGFFFPPLYVPSLTWSSFGAKASLLCGLNMHVHTAWYRCTYQVSFYLEKSLP